MSATQALPWDRAAIEAILPHRDPFVLIEDYQNQYKALWGVS